VQLIDDTALPGEKTLQLSNAFADYRDAKFPR
jgi:hypothetical protein